MMRILNVRCAIVLLVCVVTPLRSACASDVLFKCDELEQQLYVSMNDPYCTVTGLTVNHSQNVVVKNSPRDNLVKFMKFYDSTLLYLPFHLFETFAYLKTLDVSYTSILELTRNTFSAANNLTYLSLSNNNLTSVQTSVFTGANSLMRLDLSYNKITVLSENAFCGLQSLNKLQLNGNKLSELHNDIFKDNEYLESVSLESNNLTYVQPEVFNRLRRIKEVNLSNNKLLHVHPDTFAKAAGLENLMLASNYLQSFQLTNRRVADQLQLDYNNLTNLTVNATRFVRANFNKISEIYTQHAEQLETLELRGNRLTSIANITNLSELLHLDISYNPIDTLNITTFDNLRRLRNLYLRRNGIRELKFGMFSKQKYLEILDLSFNNLTSLNLNIFVPYLTSLKQFFIDGNELSELQGNQSFAHAFPVLQKLGISRNRFTCSYLHHLLVPPNLLDTVALHIEPDDSIEEKPHIRDVSCINLPHASVIAVGAATGPHTSTVQQQLELLQAHAHNLEMHLLFMKIFFYSLGMLLLIGLVAAVALRYMKLKRSGRYSRSSIVFQSNATIETNMIP